VQKILMIQKTRVTLGTLLSWLSPAFSAPGEANVISVLQKNMKTCCVAKRLTQGHGQSRYRRFNLGCETSKKAISRVETYAQPSFAHAFGGEEYRIANRALNG
jgi:hypothetical protein